LFFCALGLNFEAVNFIKNYCRSLWIHFGCMGSLKMGQTDKY
jgi:hypothetical protein